MVYGPWGRPDMAMFLLTKGILNQKPIKAFNHGKLSRDFTYIEDIVKGVVATIDQENKNGNYQLYNTGNSKPVQLLDFIEEIENYLSIKAIKEMREMQAGDVYQTFADITALSKQYTYHHSYIRGSEKICRMLSTVLCEAINENNKTKGNRHYKKHEFVIPNHPFFVFCALFQGTVLN